MSLILGILGSSGGGAVSFDSDYESIQTVTLTSGQASVEFNPIPATYTHLQIRGIARTDRTAGSTDTVFVRLNGNTGNNYSFHDIYGNGTNAFAEGTGNVGYIKGFQVGSASDASGIFGAGTIDVLDYTNTNQRRVLRILGGVDTNSAGSQNIQLSSGMIFNSTSALTSILLYPGGGTGFLQYTQFALYGIKGV